MSDDDSSHAADPDDLVGAPAADPVSAHPADNTVDLVDNVRAVWQNLAVRDPMWAVLSDPDKTGGRWDPEEFFATGEQHVDSLMADLDARGMAPRRARCLDFGCGLGRLTQSLADHFDRADGVDVAASMIERARAYNQRGDRCVFHVNETSDLALFDDDSFDLVFSFIVLQHLPADLSRRYLVEFVRVARPGGSIVFQLTSEPRSAATAQALADDAFRARLELIEPLPTVLAPGTELAVLVRATNQSDTVWPARVDGPGPFHVRVGNHWRSGRGRMRVADDGRVPLPLDVKPDESVVVRLNVTAPRESGRHRFEVDVVQEEVAWFAERGSAPASTAVLIATTPIGLACAAARGPIRVARRVPVLRRVARALVARSRAAKAAEEARRTISDEEMFEMNGVPHDEVVEVLRAAGAEVVESHEDGCAGPDWRSYTYYAQKGL